MATTRVCDRCGTRMAPHFPRTRVGDEMLCNGCVGLVISKLLNRKRPSVRQASTGESARVVERKPNEWYYEVGDEEWGGISTGGPSPTLEEAERAMIDSHGNPGGYSVSRYSSLRAIAHDSGDGERIFHCFSGDTRYVTKDGIKTLAETVGTVQQVLTADKNSREGRWVEAMIHSFGEQPLIEVRLRRNQQTKVVHATSEHRWIYRSGGHKTPYGIKTTQELKSGDRLAAALPPLIEGLTLDPEGVRHGIVYGDGTASNGYSNVHLWGEKDKQLLPWFEMTGVASVSPVVTPNGVAGVRVSAKMPDSYKIVPETDNLDYLYGWLAGYFAADGTVGAQGNIVLDSADYGSLEKVMEVALRLGIATYDISTKLRQGYGDEPTLLHSLAFVGSTLSDDFFLIEQHRDRYRFRGYGYERVGWVVDDVKQTGRVEEVFCPRVPGTESFVLEGWLHTMQCPFCGAGQQVGRSDGTAECGFCDAHYTVQVQPNHSSAPQTLDGVPHTPPEMPGDGPGEVPNEEDPFDTATEMELAPDEEEPDLKGDESPFTKDPPDKSGNPFVSYRVGKNQFDEDEFIRHLAIKFAGNQRGRVLEAVRQSRGR